MAGTVEGGKKAAETNKERYGQDFYHIQGKKGGSISRGGGFAANPKLAQMAGRLSLAVKKKKLAAGFEKVIRDGKEVSKIIVYRTAGRPKKVRINYVN